MNTNKTNSTRKISGNNARSFRHYNSTYDSCLENVLKQINKSGSKDSLSVNEQVFDIKTKNVLYLQPILSLNHLFFVEQMFENMKDWLQAFYSPCQVKILPVIYENGLVEQGVATKKNEYNRNQYNAVDILNKVNGVHKLVLNDAIGVISFTDLDLFTEKSSVFCYGYGTPEKGCLQSIQRFLPEYTQEKYESTEEFQSKLLLRTLKIVTHEVSHLFGLSHCLYSNCNMMGSKGLWQTDSNPIYLCDICQRKLKKCLKFNHVERYETLNELCRKFEGEFLSLQESEKYNQSYQEYFQNKVIFHKKNNGNTKYVESPISMPKRKNSKHLVIKTNSPSTSNPFFSQSAATTISKSNKFIIKSSVPLTRNSNNKSKFSQNSFLVTQKK